MINRLELDKNSGQPLYQQLYQQFRKNIEEGTYKGGEKLTSIRQLAKELNISRTTIENAYNQLLVEGYIMGKTGSGYYVEDIDHQLGKGEHRLHQVEKKGQELQGKKTGQKSPYYRDETLFNMKLWRKYYNKATDIYMEDIYSRSISQGALELRQQIAAYIYKYRGVVTRPEQIVIGAGVQSLLQMLCHLLKDFGYQSIGVESPGFIEPHHIFKNNGIKLKYLPVSDGGLNMSELDNAQCDLCYVTPSHQFPAGFIMPISKRLELIRWGKRENAYIIEDDYDGELIYSGQPVPALQGLDKGKRVIYLGSLSTLFIPTVRISYMVLPEKLLEPYNEIKHLYNPTVATSEQYALALFMEEGEFERHIRRLKNLLNKKNKSLKEEIKKQLGHHVEITSGECGTYMVLKFKPYVNVGELSTLCRAKGIALAPITKFSKHQHDYDNIGQLSYRDVPLGKIEKVVADLGEILVKMN